MKRTLFLLAAGLVLTSVVGAISAAFALNALWLVPGILLVAYVAIVDPPVEAALFAAATGLLLDALMGTPLGLNLLACVLSLLVSRLAIGWVTSVRGVEASVFAGGLSILYAFFALVGLNLFQDRSSLGLVSMLVLGIVHCCAAFVLFPVLARTLSWLGLEERGETLRDRLTRNARAAATDSTTRFR